MNRTYLLLLASVFILPSCTAVGVATGVGATAGIAAAQEGGLSRAADDARIQLEINDLWFKYNVEMFRKLDLTINQGRVLITGVVQNPEHRVEAVRLAWQPKGVEQVINEIRVADSDGIVGFAKDTWITTRIRTALTLDREVSSINYSIDTVQGTVYLMGFAQNREELNRVIEISRTVKGVNGVVSYVKFVGGDRAVGNSPDAGQNNYTSTYDENYVVQDPATGQYQPYDNSQAPIELTPPPAVQEDGRVLTYPVDGGGAQIQRVEEPIVIQDNPLGGPSQVQSQSIESEDILWNDQ